MKLIKLELQGLNSFIKKTEINFENLFEKGIFGIFGATGSGKSTILDAIFLALYGKILRTKTEKEFINVHTQAASVKLRFELRESGVDKIFEVSRNYSLNEKKNVVKRAKLVIINGKQMITLAKTDTTTTEKIKEIIGFGDEEFQRVIALPQGQFAKFLGDSSANKIDTVAKLFNLQDYGKEFALNLKYQKSENEKRREYLRGVLEQYVDTDEKVVANNEIKLRDLKDQAKLIATKYSESKKELLAMEKLKALIEERSTIKTRLKKLKLKQRKFDEDFYKLNILKTTFALFPEYSKLKAIETEKQSLDNKKDSLSSEIAAIENSYFQLVSVNKQNKINFTTKLAECERRHSLLLDAKKDAEKYRDLETEKNNLVHLMQTKNKKLKKLEDEYESNALSLDNSLKILKELDEAYEIKIVAQSVIDAISKLTVLNSEIGVYQTMLAGLEKEQSALASKKQGLLDELLKGDERLNKLRKQLYDTTTSLKQLFDEDEGVEHAIEKATREICELKLQGGQYLVNQNEIKKLKQTTANKLVEIKEEKQVLTNVESDLKKVEEHIAKISRELRDLEFLKDKEQNENLIGFLKNDLDIGDDCPLCNAKIAELSKNVNKKDKNYQFLFSQKQEELEKLNALKDDLFVSFTETNKNVNFLNEQRDLLLHQISDLNKRQKALEKENPEFTSLTQSILDNKVSKQQGVLTKLQGLLKAVNKTKDLTYAKERICVKISASVEQLNKQEVLLNEKIENYQAIIGNLQLEKAQLEQLEKEGALKDAVAFDEYSQKQNEMLKQQKNVVPQIIKFVELKETSSIKYFNALADYNQDELKLENINSDMESIVVKLRDLNVNGYVQDEIASNLSNITTIRQEISSMEEQEGELLQAETKLKLEKASVISAIAMKDQEIENAKDKLKGQCDLAGITENDLKTEVVYDDITKLEASVNEYRRDLDDAQDDLIRVEKTIDGRIVNKSDLTRCENTVKKHEDEYVAIASEAMLLERQIEKDKENLKKLTYFRTEYSGVVSKQKQLEELSQLNDNDAILKFITEEYILNITEKANVYFAMLTNGRYQLLFNNDFVVVDNINGGVTRSVGTLSGGETFLASLAVAIAMVETLATINARPLDFVFLDEGFGTLDENSLEMVMNAIRNLRKTKLVFGLITHEELVKFQTPTRIEVTKTVKEGSKADIIL